MKIYYNFVVLPLSYRLGGLLIKLVETEKEKEKEGRRGLFQI